jgi:hypothetical protein
MRSNRTARAERKARRGHRESAQPSRRRHSARNAPKYPRLGFVMPRAAAQRRENGLHALSLRCTCRPALPKRLRGFSLRFGGAGSGHGTIAVGSLQAWLRGRGCRNRASPARRLAAGEARLTEEVSPRAGATHASALHWPPSSQSWSAVHGATTSVRHTMQSENPVELRRTPAATPTVWRRRCGRGCSQGPARSSVRKRAMIERYNEDEGRPVMRVVSLSRRPHGSTAWWWRSTYPSSAERFR